LGLGYDLITPIREEKGGRGGAREGTRGKGGRRRRRRRTERLGLFTSADSITSKNTTTTTTTPPPPTPSLPHLKNPLLCTTSSFTCFLWSSSSCDFVPGQSMVVV